MISLNSGASMKIFRFSLSDAKITTRLMFWFLAISLVPSLLLTVITNWISVQSLQEAVRHQLMAISEAKASELETYIRERRGDMAILSRSPSVIQGTSSLGELRGKDKEGVFSATFLAASRNVRELLRSYIEVYGYQNFYLFDVEGNLLLRSKSDIDLGLNLLTGPLKDSEMAEVFRRSRMLLQAELSDYQIYEGLADGALFIAHPVFKDGATVGMIVMQLGNRELSRVFSDYHGLGDTGETLAAMVQGDEMVYVAATRHGQNPAFKMKLPLKGSPDDKGSAMRKAVQGHRSYGEAVDYRDHQVLAAWSYLPSFRWGMLVKQDRAEAFEMINQQRMAVGALMALCGLAVVGIAWTVARSIARPIRTAADAANRVADGDLTGTCEGEAGGEAGLLLSAVRTMTGDLRALIGRIQRSSITLLSTATEIAATSRHQEQAIYDYGASTNEAAAAVNQISATSQELLRTMNDVNQVANQSAKMASAGQKSLGGMDRTMRQLADSTTSIGSKLSIISERAANINLVVTTITKVADQTNLLSINAAIEAEKAGEYGLGFLVVAREIRRLADQTAVATLDIERMVKEMQYSVSAGVMEMDKFSEQVRQVVSEVGTIGGQLGQIITSVQGLGERFDQVTEGMRVQSQGADQIREAMIRLSEAASQTTVSLREFNKATDSLREAVSDLKEEVSRFKIGEAEAVPMSFVSRALGPPSS